GGRRRGRGFLLVLPQDAFQEALQLPRPDRVLQLPDRLGLDLPDALARHLEDAAHLFEGVGVSGADAVAQLDDLALAERQRLQNRLDLLLPHRVRRRRDRALRRLVLDEVPEVGVVALADRAVERDRVLRDLQDALGLLERDLRLVGDLLERRLAAVPLGELL